MDLPGHDGKVTPDMKMICKSYQRYKGENTDYCHFSVIFETAKKFLFIYFYFSLLFCQN